jgi:hypothetical protein
MMLRCDTHYQRAVMYSFLILFFFDLYVLYEISFFGSPDFFMSTCEHDHALAMTSLIMGTSTEFHRDQPKPQGQWPTTTQQKQAYKPI